MKPLHPSPMLLRLSLVAGIAAVLALALPGVARAQVSPPAAPADTTPRDADDDLAPDEAEVDEPPALLSPGQLVRLAQQSYPEELRRTGTEGTVVVWMMIEPDGHVRRGSVHVATATHPAFVEPARRIAQRLRYRAATLRGAEVAAPMRLPIVFVLHPQ